MLKRASAYLAGIPVIFASITVFNAIPSEGHGATVSCLQSYFVRIENEQFSSNNATVGESVRVTGELRSLVNRQLVLQPIPIADREKIKLLPDYEQYRTSCGLLPSTVVDQIRASEWQIVNSSFLTDPKGQITIDSGETLPFSINIKSTEPGYYSLVSGYVLYTESNGTEIGRIYLGRGMPIQVKPSATQLQTCKELGITEDRCSDKTILQSRLHDSYWIIEPPVQYFIGIGAIIAAIVAFFAWRKSR